MTSAAHPPRTFEIKKYPNRRFYDVTRSRHVTLDDLYELVKAGDMIAVTDSKTGADITNVVLTQIILEHDPPKLDLFPAPLLHQAIQANQQMIRRFVDEYFSRAINAFTESRRSFDEFLRKSGFSALQPMAPFDWVRMLIPGAGAGHQEAAGQGGDRRDAADHHAHVNKPGSEVEALRREMETMRSELAELRRKPGRKAGGSKRRK